MGFSAICESGSLLGFMAPRPGDTRPVTHPIGTKLPPFTFQPDVTGFEATATAERQVIAGLPEGVTLRAELLGLIAALKQIDVWLEKGRRAQAWASAAGIGDECWVDDDGALRLPDGVTNPPGFVTDWISEAAEVGAIIDVLGI